jgi:hypothetical protein
MFVEVVPPSQQTPLSVGAMMSHGGIRRVWRIKMRKSVFLIALLAASVSVPAIAKDGKVAKSGVESVRVEEKPFSGPTRLGDAEMDKVTAGISGTGAVHRSHACGRVAPQAQIPFC